MPLDNEHLRSIPLLAGLTDDQLTILLEAFERVELKAGASLCVAGEPARQFFILARGEVTVGDGVTRYVLHPPAPIGELGALAGLYRAADAAVTEEAEVWRVGGPELLEFLQSHPDIGLVFYQNLTRVLAGKVRRDQLRLEDMRRARASTQDEVHSLRDLLEREETPVSREIYSHLNELVTNNRRTNYRVVPTEALPITVRLAGAAAIPLADLSRTHLSYRQEAGPLPVLDELVEGTLALAGPDIPFTGRVFRLRGDRITVELDDLEATDAATLEGLISRAQMVDFLV